MFFSSRRRRHRIGGFGALNSVRGDLEHPGQNTRDWQTENNEQYNQSNDPVWNIENWKNLRDSLRERPTGDDVSDRDFVNIAPLQLGKKVAQIHEAETRKVIADRKFHHKRACVANINYGSSPRPASELFELEFGFDLLPRNERFASVLRDSCFEIAQVFEIFNAFLKSNHGLIERL